MSNTDKRIAALEEAARLRLDRLKGTEPFFRRETENFLRDQLALGYTHEEIRRAIGAHVSDAPHPPAEQPVEINHSSLSAPRPPYPLRPFGGY